MLFQSDTATFSSDDQIVHDLFKNFVDTDDPAFLSSPESDYGFITPPPPPVQDIDYSVPPVPTTPTAELYPRLSKKPRGGVDIERWTNYLPTTRQYYALYDANQQELGSQIDVHTKIDKVDQREHFSAADDAYILYRQNQFQLDIDMFGNLGNYSSNPPTPSATSPSTTTTSSPMYVDLGGVLAPVECLYYHIYAVRQHKNIPLGQGEDQEALVDLVQLGGPRNRKDFQLPGLSPIVMGRATYARLQFRAATPNNARVHPDQPNPNQQYYRIVLSLVAKTANSLNFIFSKISPCLMVRGQNPGKFQGGKPQSPTEPKQEYTHPTYAQPQPLNLNPVPQDYDQSTPKLLSPSQTPLGQPSTQNYNQNYIQTQNSNQNFNQPQLLNTPQNPNPTQLPVLVSQPSSSSSSSNTLPQPPPRGTKRPPENNKENDGWTKDNMSGNMYTAAKVGINTASPQEALTVHGNILYTGELLKPSDERIKTNITPITTSSQLETIEKLRLYDYELKTATGSDGQPMRERGVLAQELQRVMPSAVKVLKNVTLSDGTVMPELLVVQDRALLFENIGATQALSQSVREQRSRLTALSERVSHQLHEMGQTTKKAVDAMGTMMGFMLTEKKINYENSCFFLSIFGLGPAWTMYILGFFLPFLWFFGMFYIASAVPVKKSAGYAHFVTMVLYGIYIGIILAWPTISLKAKLISLGAVAAVGIIIIITFGIYWRRKQNERTLALEQGLLQSIPSVAPSLHSSTASTYSPDGAYPNLQIQQQLPLLQQPRVAPYQLAARTETTTTTTYVAETSRRVERQDHGEGPSGKTAESTLTSSGSGPKNYGTANEPDIVASSSRGPSTPPVPNRQHSRAF